jgi:hypothetical protein
MVVDVVSGIATERVEVGIGNSGWNGVETVVTLISDGGVF